MALLAGAEQLLRGATRLTGSGLVHIADTNVRAGLTMVQDGIDSPLCAALVTEANSAMASTMSADLDFMPLQNDACWFGRSRQQRSCFLSCAPCRKGDACSSQRVKRQASDEL